MGYYFPWRFKSSLGYCQKRTYVESDVSPFFVGRLFCERIVSAVLLFAYFIRLQNSAGLEPRLKAEDQWYGFHDLRRGFATNNYQALSALEVTQVTGDAARQPQHDEALHQHD